MININKITVQVYAADHNELPNIKSSECQINEDLELLRQFYRLTKEMSLQICILSTVSPNTCILEIFLSKIVRKDQGVPTIKEELVTSFKMFLLFLIKIPVFLKSDVCNFSSSCCTILEKIPNV